MALRGVRALFQLSGGGQAASIGASTFGSSGFPRTAAADGGVRSNAWQVRLAVPQVPPAAEVEVCAMIELENMALPRISELYVQLSSGSHRLTVGLADASAPRAPA
jgi:hypothetical protein